LHGPLKRGVSGVAVSQASLFFCMKKTGHDVLFSPLLSLTSSAYDVVQHYFRRGLRSATFSEASAAEALRAPLLKLQKEEGTQSSLFLTLYLITTRDPTSIPRRLVAFVFVFVPRLEEVLVSHFSLFREFD